MSGDCTDLRQGVTPAEHAVFDAAEPLKASTDPAEYHLRLANRAAAAALRAQPNTGMGARRVKQTREAIAQLLAALAKMDEGGREVRR